MEKDFFDNGPKRRFPQIPMHEESRPITGKSTPIGLQQWRVVMMAWKNGVQYCQQNLETVFEPISDIVAGYVDDILTGTDGPLGESTTEFLLRHDREIRTVLEEMRKAKLVADKDKCDFFVKRVTFCGHILEEGTM